MSGGRAVIKLCLLMADIELWAICSREQNCPETAVKVANEQTTGTGDPSGHARMIEVDPLDGVVSAIPWSEHIPMVVELSADS